MSAGGSRRGGVGNQAQFEEPTTSPQPPIDTGVRTPSVSIIIIVVRDAGSCLQGGGIWEMGVVVVALAALALLSIGCYLTPSPAKPDSTAPSSWLGF